ncbi:hypothetical protein I601_0354 [Nocardioides dokdonensis FR1436]|uniref:Transglycosylase SLT domain-containing protein n=1 Tax=Nocardioides dokdonensis FR1436 TaxID=1300347 RepID=A0A1A9GEU6_9ACTN|nr:lytic murein transglycosylase [Nocardioides dokdonensis]ANH36807.1 hypothetical protein I601_0354 [Nocardioides dokdonensis FR1436]
MSGPRSIVLFASLLLVLSAAAFGLSRLYTPQRTVDLTPPAAFVAAPVPPQADPGSPVRRTQLVDDGWLRRTSRATGIPAPALRAYADAQLSRVGGCDVGWTTLAGIGWIESQHGTLGGRTIDDAGRSSSPILGPALDGSGDFAAIRSTAASREWHGDATWEHAVGPMQFLRSSWEPWAADGDRDGVIDPLDLDDAAATAARYLCAGGRDLAAGDGWADAVLSYNHSDEYVAAVHSAASSYAERAAGRRAG